jgi:mannonate dehydratase
VRVREDGSEALESSMFRVPDAYVCSLARANPAFLACASVHPYRADALARLEAAAAGGARAIKWLPNAMGIDPASPRCDAFYDRLRALGLVLITHTGTEHAVDAAADQELGNPLRLRRALGRGARVVAAHCASLGRALDLDHPERGSAPALDLFLRLMGEAGTEGLLYGDISAVTQVNRGAEALRTLLLAGDLHPRLVNGSDYPLPAIDHLISTRLLVHRGFVAAGERAPLEEIFEANALLYDFVLKRRLRVADGGREAAFAPALFESARLFA